MALSAAKSRKLNLPKGIVLAVILATGAWTAFAAQSFFFENPIISGTLFTIAFLHVLIALPYCFFVQHRTRWMTMAIVTIAVCSFGKMCIDRYERDAPQNYEGPVWGMRIIL